MQEKSNCLDYPLRVCVWDIDIVALVVIGGWSQIPTFHAMLYKRASFGRSLKNEYLCDKGCHGGAFKIKGPIELRICG